MALSSNMQLVIVALYAFVLYYAFIPKVDGGPLITLPSDTSDHKMVHVVHGVLFVLVFLFTSKYIVKYAGGSSMF
jgi:hypothetical protein